MASESTSSSATSATTGQNRLDPVMRRRAEGAAGAAAAVGASGMVGPTPAGDELHDLPHGRLGPRQFGDLVVVAQHGDPVGEPEHLLQLGGDEHDGHAVRGQVDDELLDLGFGADVDAAGGLVE